MVNGGGRIEREYAAGTGRMDLRVELKGAVLAIEVKVWRDGDKRGDPTNAGVAQLEGYMARVGAEQGWLVMFDQRACADEITARTRALRANTKSGRDVVIVLG